jgi:hypothetical protein
VTARKLLLAERSRKSGFGEIHGKEGVSRYGVWLLIGERNKPGFSEAIKRGYEELQYVVTDWCKILVEARGVEPSTLY